jgi:hypothetical protein
VAVALEELAALAAPAPEPDVLPEGLSSVPLLDELPAEANSVFAPDELPAAAVSVPEPVEPALCCEFEDPLVVELVEAPPLTGAPSSTSPPSPPDPSLPTRVGISMSVGLRPAAARAIKPSVGLAGAAPLILSWGSVRVLSVRISSELALH